MKLSYNTQVPSQHIKQKLNTQAINIRSSQLISVHSMKITYELFFITGYLIFNT